MIEVFEKPFCHLYAQLHSLFLSGYMSPEYAMHGLYSTKSDVYSFGVLVLEIINGKRNSSFHQTDSNGSNLVTYVSIEI